jgi:hypothetical protein
MVAEAVRRDQISPAHSAHLEVHFDGHQHFNRHPVQ